MVERQVLKQMARDQISGNIGMLFVCYLVILIKEVISAALSIINQSGLRIISPALSVIGQIGLAIISPALSIGMILIYLGITKGVKPEVERIFDGFKYFGKALGLYILMGLFTLLWSMLFYIPGIIKALSYSMAPYILAENPEISPLEAISDSKIMMEGNKMDLFVLYLSFLGWILLGCMTLGIAFIYVVPYMQTTIANFYNSIKPHPVTYEPANSMRFR